MQLLTGICRLSWENLMPKKIHEKHQPPCFGPMVRIEVPKMRWIDAVSPYYNYKVNLQDFRRYKRVLIRALNVEN